MIPSQAEIVPRHRCLDSAGASMGGHQPRLDAEPSPDADVVIVAEGQEARLRRRLRGTYRREIFLLRPRDPVVVYVATKPF